jgi:hypothetical protein
MTRYREPDSHPDIRSIIGANTHRNARGYRHAGPTHGYTDGGGVYVTVTCSNVPVMWAQKRFPKGSILGIATWHNLTIGAYFGVGF